MPKKKVNPVVITVIACTVALIIAVFLAQSRSDRSEEVSNLPMVICQPECWQPECCLPECCQPECVTKCKPGYVFRSKAFCLKVEIGYDNGSVTLIKVSKRMTNKNIETSDLSLGENEKRNPMLMELSRIRGIESAWMHPYEIYVKRASNFFSWKELMPQVEKVITKHMANLK